MFKLSTSLVFFIAFNLSYSVFAMEIETVDYVKIKHIDEKLITQTHVKFKIRIDDETAKYLASKLKHNTQLISLDLSYQAISPQGAFYIASALKQNSHLEELYLNGNHIDDEGAEHFAMALETNKTLKDLELIFCGIGNKGVEYFTNCLSKNTALKKLGLDSGKISPENWGALMAGLEKRRLD